MNTVDAHLPRILCLHGRGTSGLIFSFQCRNITHALRDHFRLVFIDAPFGCGPGPGVVPIFEEAGPFYEWTPKNAAEGERVRSLLHRKLREENGAPVVGVLGFSQGARVAAGLLHERQQNAAVAPDLSFGVIVNGGYPPLRQVSNSSMLLPGLSEAHRVEWEWNDQHEGCIHLPSVHVHATRDSMLASSRTLARCFDPTTATIMEYDNAHHLPVSPVHITAITAEIIRIYAQAQAKGVVVACQENHH